jgi:hypothetical protein
MAKNLTKTAHYRVRARQRGYRQEDFAIVERLGIFTGDGIFVRKRDVAPEIERLSRVLRHMRRRASRIFHQPGIEVEEPKVESKIVQQIERLQRLPGVFIPIESGQALSIYRPCSRRVKRLFRDRRRWRWNRRYWR